MLNWLDIKHWSLFPMMLCVFKVHCLVIDESIRSQNEAFGSGLQSWSVTSIILLSPVISPSSLSHPYNVFLLISSSPPFTPTSTPPVSLRRWRGRSNLTFSLHQSGWVTDCMVEMQPWSCLIWRWWFVCLFNRVVYVLCSHWSILPSQSNTVGFGN